jgi:hypothetical protein
MNLVTQPMKCMNFDGIASWAELRRFFLFFEGWVLTAMLAMQAEQFAEVHDCLFSN